MTPALNSLSLPLSGTLLIEASAGTGKTWTIASLFLRLVLGLQGPLDRPLAPREILILTFTRAATKELVDRIRLRLVQALAFFEDRLEPELADAFLHDLRAQVQGPAALEQAIQRLQQASITLDEAAVLTIDAWVQRLLQEHLLAVGASHPERLLESDAAWQLQAVQDYWRQQIYPLDAPTMQAVADVVPHPMALWKWLAPALNSGNPLPRAPIEPLGALLGARCAARAAQLAQLRAGWDVRADVIRAWFEACLQANPKAFNGNTLRGGLKTVEGWCATLSRWAQGQSSWLPGVNAGPTAERRLRERLTPGGLMALHNKASRPADEGSLPPWSQDFETLVNGLDRLDQVHESLGLHAMGWVGERLVQLKQAQRAWTFDDLLSQAIEGLRSAPDKANRLRVRYPAALIDEFQDTSPRQLALIHQIYPLAPVSCGTQTKSDPNHVLLLIGDPKQSIYRFRGADIHAYLQTPRSLAGRIHALDCNRRSTPEVVQVVNHVFSTAERRGLGETDGGAFLHGADVPFDPVQSAGPKERLVGAHGVLPALCIWTEPLARGPDDGRALDAARAAQRMVGLLNDPSVGFQGPKGPFRRLQARDCCVLVRTGVEAQAIRRALWDRGIPSAYLSERDTILESAEAFEVLLLLQALREPQHLGRARALWACSSMALPLSQQLHERDDDALWEVRLQTLQDCALRWAAHGVLAAVRHFVRVSGVAGRSLADAAQGARRLTNWLHLGEWLQALSERHPTPSALLEAYAPMVADPDQALQTKAGLRDATLLRLESDQDVVQVVTIHKSKGLQYPLVWMPFAVAHREPPRSSPPMQWVWGQAGWVLSTDAGDSAEDEEALEVLREDVRLLYVGMTRAVHQLWLGACPRRPREDRPQNWHRSALGHLLSGRNQVRSDDEVVNDVRCAFRASNRQPLGCTEAGASSHEATHQGRVGVGAALDVMVDVLDPTVREPQTQRVLPIPDLSQQASYRPARRVVQPVTNQWRVSSYTALARGAGHSVSFRRPAPWDEPEVSDASGLAVVVQDNRGGPWHQWPSSAAFGQFLHELLEEGAAFGFVLEPGSHWARLARARIAASEWAAQGESLLDWLGHIVHKQVLPGAHSLSSLTHRQAELEFWMPLSSMDTRTLDDLLIEHVWPGLPRPPLQSQQMEGLLMGFADLSFECNGRYEVLDYKSNRLGTGPDAYHPHALQQAVLEHRYDLQAAVYLLAMYRLLRHRLGPHFDAVHHLGGAHFMFLRGIDRADGALLSIPADAVFLGALDEALGGTSRATPAAHPPAVEG